MAGVHSNALNNNRQYQEDPGSTSYMLSVNNLRILCIQFVWLHAAGQT